MTNAHVSSTDTHVSSKGATIVWLILVVASVGTTWVGDHHAAFAKWSAVIIMVVAAFKSRVILTYYMDLKASPLSLRIAYDAWILATTVSILYLWLLV